MDVKKINLYLEQYGEYFPSEQMINIRRSLSTVPDKYLDQITATKLLNPTHTQVASVIGGAIGIDRFLLGDKALGFVKMFTGGGFGIFALVDMFLVQGNTKKKNYDKLMKCILSISDPVQAPVVPYAPPAVVVQPAPVAPKAPVAPAVTPLVPPASAPVTPSAKPFAVPVTPLAPPVAAPVKPPVATPVKPPVAEEAVSNTNDAPVATEPAKPAAPTMAPTPPKKK